MSDALVQALITEVAQLRKEVDELREEVEKLKVGGGGATSSWGTTPPVAASKPKISNFGKKFHQWTSQSLSNSPQKLIRPYSAIKDGKVYFTTGRASDRSAEAFLVVCLDIEKDKWITLPKGAQYFGALAVVQDMLTYIGGKEEGTGLVTGNLMSYQVSKIENF